MQITLPVHTVNLYLVVYIDTTACYYYVDKVNSLDNKTILLIIEI